MLYFRNLAAALLIAGAPLAAMAQTATQAAPATTVPDATAPAATPDAGAAPAAKTDTAKSTKPVHRHRHHAAKPAAPTPQR